jgi:tetratricopeptide (TPR) repeat protein/mono/diheme cytochrome c family protein
VAASTRKFLGAVAAAFAISAGARAQSPPTAQRLAPTFSKDVAPILYARCAGCHRTDGAAPFPLLTYNDARQHASQIAAVTANRYMPPWKPEHGVGDFVGERRLTDNEIRLLHDWSVTGAAAGDPALLPAVPRFTPGWQLGQPDLVVTLPEYTLRGDGLDVFRNFVVTIPVTGARFVRGLEFRPGNSAVHHANIRVDATLASRRLDDADPEPGYEGLILNSAEYPDGYFLGWTPGQIAPFLPKGFAWQLTGGTDFVVQLHMRPTGKPERIQPSIGLFFTNEAPTKKPAMLRLGRQNIDIPPGDADYHSIDSYTLQVDAEIQAIQPHSHYRARNLRAWAVLPDHTTRQLIKIPQWDFSWQDTYRYAAPFWLPAGTTLFTEYVFDNSTDNPRNPESPPRRALWGSRSSDEMGDVWIQVLTRGDAERKRLVEDFRVKADAEDIEGYETRIRVNPDQTALHNDVAVLYLEVGRPDAAVPHFEAVARLQPQSSVAHFNLGTALDAAGRFSDAAQQYEEAVALDPTYVRARVNFGNARLRAGDVTAAAVQYRAALNLDPQNADAQNNLGRTLLALGNLNEAATHISEALRLRHDYPEAHFNMAEVLAATNQPRLAIEHYRAAIDLRPDWVPCLARFSWLLSTYPDAAVRNPDEAVRLSAKAVEISQHRDAAALDALAAAYASAGRFDEAVSTAMIATKLAAAGSEQSAQMEKRLALYRQGRPYVASAP